MNKVDSDSENEAVSYAPIRKVSKLRRSAKRLAIFTGIAIVPVLTNTCVQEKMGFDDYELKRKGLPSWDYITERGVDKTTNTLTSFIVGLDMNCFKLQNRSVVIYENRRSVGKAFIAPHSSVSKYTELGEENMGMVHTEFRVK